MTNSLLPPRTTPRRRSSQATAEAMVSSTDSAIRSLQVEDDLLSSRLSLFPGKARSRSASTGLGLERSSDEVIRGLEMETSSSRFSSMPQKLLSRNSFVPLLLGIGSKYKQDVETVRLCMSSEATDGEDQEVRPVMGKKNSFLSLPAGLARKQSSPASLNLDFSKNVSSALEGPQSAPAQPSLFQNDLSALGRNDSTIFANNNQPPRLSVDSQPRPQLKKKLSSLLIPPFPLLRRRSSAISETSDHTATSSLATSILPSPTENAPKTDQIHTPPQSRSEYKWNYLETSEAQGARKVWWRTIDAMANFILHWQNRFHQQGDMFGSCTLSLDAPDCSTQLPLNLSQAQLREAMRRLRWSHPSIALRLAKRSELEIPALRLPEYINGKVDLQVALVYDCVETEADISSWLDEVAIIHTEPRMRDEEEEFRSFLTRATGPDVPGRDRMKIHFWPHDLQNNVDARILIEQSHSVSEGIGTLIAFDLVLESIASVLAEPVLEIQEFKWGEEVTRLEPALQDAVLNQPLTWDVSKKELAAVQKVNEERMSGKASPPNVVDKLGGKVVGMTLRNYKSCSHLRSKVLNKPLVSLCKGVAEKGEMLPLGLLPQDGKPFEGEITHTSFLSTTLEPEQTQRLLALLKQRGLTLAPFLEACSNMATTWTRKHRGLIPNPHKNDGWDDPDRFLGSYSNAISKRDTLQPAYRRYLGLCMSGFPTKISTATARWSPGSEKLSHPSPSNPADLLPSPTPSDLVTLFGITHTLALQYQQGRTNPNWLRHDKALMYDTMSTEFLFLPSRTHYPSMPWLSSLGKLEPIFSPSHPLPSGTSRLQAHNMRLLGRNGCRQPVLHVWSFRMQTTIQFSFANWWYPDPASRNILTFWLAVFKSLIHAVLQSSDTQSPSQE